MNNKRELRIIEVPRSHARCNRACDKCDWADVCDEAQAKPIPLELLFDLALTDADRTFLAVMKVGL